MDDHLPTPPPLVPSNAQLDQNVSRLASRVRNLESHISRLHQDRDAATDAFAEINLATTEHITAIADIATRLARLEDVLVETAEQHTRLVAIVSKLADWAHRTNDLIRGVNDNATATNNNLVLINSRLVDVERTVEQMRHPLLMVDGDGEVKEVGSWSGPRLVQPIKENTDD